MLRVLLDNDIDHKLLQKTASDIIKSSQNVNRSIKSKKNINFNDKILSTLINDNIEVMTFHNLSNFLFNIHPNHKVRKVAYKINDLYSCYLDKLNKDKQLYNVLNKLLESGDLNNEEYYFFNQLIKGYNSDGILLNNPDQLNKQKNNIRLFIKNINNELRKNKIFGLNKLELAGLPEYIKKLYFNINSDDPNKVGYYLNSYMFDKNMSYLKYSNIRKKLEFLYYSRGIDKIKDFYLLSNARQNISKILNLNNYVEYKNDNNMIPKPDDIRKILNMLNRKIDDRFNRDIINLLKIKQKDCKELKLNYDGKINSWDILYLIKKWKTLYGCDDDLIRNYFILSRTIPKLLAIIGDIFGIEFVLIKNNAYTDRVQVFKITDDDNTKYGYMYFDLFHRKNKKNSPNCYLVQPGVSYPYKKSIQESIVVITENFPLTNNYGLASNELFHLINHVSQGILFILSKFNLPISSVSMEKDTDKIFIFICRHLFQNIDLVKQLSSHKNTREEIPDELAIKMIKSKKLCNGLFYKKQVFTSLFDHLIHSSTKLQNALAENINNENKLKEIYINCYKNLYNVIMNNKINLNKDIFPPIGWNHLYDNRSSLYHSHLFSEIIACDILNTLLEKNHTYLEIGNIIKNKLLKSYNVKHAIKDILDRNFTLDGFLTINDFDNNNEYSFFFPEDYSSNNNVIDDSTTFNKDKLINSNYYTEKDNNSSTFDVSERNENHNIFKT